MAYKNLNDCITDLEKHKHLVRIKEEVDANLEMAAIHLRVHEIGGPALLFDNVKGCEFKAASNLFGTMERSRFIFRDTLQTVQQLIALKDNPLGIIKKPLLAFKARMALPKKISGAAVQYAQTTIEKLPQIKHWPMDGGAFVTLPAVYSEDIEKPGIMQSNLGMYRIQLSGNDYEMNKEIGLHYQLHRGIGVHQTKANARNKPLKVSVFVGGPPANIFSAVMPLPENMSELTFAGMLGGRRFRYTYDNGFCLSADADFVITGEVHPHENKTEGPFGDHFGYYSLKHPFPLMRVHKVWHRKNAIWPFTVVGRPPQEDTAFGNLIHELAGNALPKEIPGLKELNAVDAAGVHPLLLAIGSERYTPYIKEKKPQEILTIANHILGTGQLSLAKYLFICSKEDKPQLNTHDIQNYFSHVLERIDFTRDVHFQTKTTIDTLDYSGTEINSGSKVIFAAAGEKRRELSTTVPEINLPDGFSNPKIAIPGVLIIQAKYSAQIQNLKFKIQNSEIPLIVIADDAEFTARTLNNFLWVTFTRSNPSNDIYGIDEFTENKHWGCRGSLIIDARIKPHHAPVLEKDAATEKKIDRLFAKSGSLYGLK